MAILANRVKARNNILEFLKLVNIGLQKICAGILIIISLGLLYFSTPNILSNILLEITGRAISAGALIYQTSLKQLNSAYEWSVNFRHLEEENIKLRLEIAELKKNQISRDLIFAENKYLRKILKVVENNNNNFITAQLLSVTNSPFASSAVIRAGKKHHVKVNDIVTSDNNLLGRVTSVSDNYSTVMLINDQNSRIPIITSKSKERGILAKQGNDMKIIYFDENHLANEGEEIFTSGDGKIYPQNIKVATITKINNEGIFVKFAVDFKDIEFVNVNLHAQNE